MSYPRLTAITYPRQWWSGGNEILRIKRTVFWLCVCLTFSGCGKKEEKIEDTEVDSSWKYLGWTFTEEGLLYHNPNPPRRGKLEYLDYRTGSYRPLCASASCLHDSAECTAVRLYDAGAMGRIGDKWYYLMRDESGIPHFYSCDLDGQNEKKIGKYSHTGSQMFLFFEDSCVTAFSDPVMDEETGQLKEDVSSSAICRYHFDTGEEELLTQESESSYYDLYGRYGKLLLYREYRDGRGILKVLDLDTGEVQEPLGDRNVARAASMRDGLFACNVREGDDIKLIELDLVTGNWKEIQTEAGGGASLFWSEGLKLMTFWEERTGGAYYRVYQYLDDGKSVLVREGEESTYFEVLDRKDGLLVGRYGGSTQMEEQFHMATMEEKDFLAGKDNWIVLEY